MIKTYSICFFLFLIELCNANAGWKAINPYRYPSMCSVSFSDTETGYVTGEKSVYKTTDGGKTWFVIKSDSKKSFHTVCVLGKDSVWVGDGESCIHRTFDGGKTWDSVSLASQGIYSEIFQVSMDANGYGTAYSGSAIFNTKDFGNTWALQELPSGSYFLCYSHCGADTILLSTRDEIWRSSDRGSTWSFKKISDIRSICFNSGVGYALSSRGTILKSTDTGFSWIESFVPSVKSKIAISLRSYSEKRIFAFGEGGVIAYTTDGGVSWIEPANANNDELFYGMAWVDSTTIFGVGTNSSIIRSIDLGNSWEYIIQSEPTRFYHVQFVGNNRAWSIGPTNVSHSTDGGLNWMHCQSLNKLLVGCMSFANDSVGLVGSEEGNVYRTTNAGKSWDTILISNTCVEAIYCFDATNCIVSNSNGQLLRTTNAGSDWVTTSGNEDNNIINSFSFVDCNRGWAAGEQGTILSTSNGGASWSRLPTHTNNFYEKVQFIDVNRGWAVGEIGLIARTIDGGFNWTTDTIPSMPFLYSVCFINKDTGWVAGSGGIILVSTNGGKNWYEQASYTNDHLRCILMNPDCTGMAFSSNTSILKYTPDSVLIPEGHTGVTEYNTKALHATVNVVKSILLIDLASDPTTQIELKIYNLSGELVTECSLLKRQNEIDISEMGTGAYFVRLTDGKNCASYKFAISR